MDEDERAERPEADQNARYGGTMWGLLTARPGRKMLANVGHKMVRAPVFFVSRLSRRDKGKWVFGNHKGFRDSPRFLAEFIVHSRPEIEAWWIARSPDEAERALATGLRVAMFGTDEAAKVQRQAGVAFYCNSFRDLNLSYVAGAYLVHLYHGTPLKRISLDVDRSRFTRRSPLLRGLAVIGRWSLARKYGMVNMFVAAGELAKSRYVSAFGAKPERIRPIGTPRFDVIRGGPAYERVAGGDVRARLGYGPEEKLVLWLPTWREQGDAAWLPALSGAQLDQALGGSNVRLLVKTHPFSDRSVYEQRLPRHPSLRLLPEEAVDVNCLLHIADALITDYSSAAFDYAILERPIHFLAPDVESYAAGRDLYEPYEKLTGGMHHRQWDALLAVLRQEGTGPESEGAVLARRVADYAGNNTEANVCARLVTAISQETGLVLAGG